MNTTKLFLLAVVSFVLTQVNLSANDAEEFISARENLTKEITNIVQDAPFELVSNYDSENKVSISFSVVEGGKIISVKVDGQNEALTNWVRNNLERSSLEVDPVLDGIKYRVPVAYKVW